jgi:ABC-type multidrug transport system fused ATPase/permease subunit
MERMDSWIDYLKRGLARKTAGEEVPGTGGQAKIRTNLKNLYPFALRHWRKGALGGVLILVASLFTFPQPLIFRYLIDSVILSRRADLLMGAVLLLLGVAVFEKLSNLWQEFYFSRFEQEALLDLQNTLLERALRFSKSFYDRQETGYLMARLSSDVQGLRWFLSSGVVHLAANALRFIGGLVFLLYLEWRLTVVVLIILPGLLLSIRFFASRIHLLSHQNMEQEARVQSGLQESLSSVSLIKAFSKEMQTLGRLISEIKRGRQLSLEQSTLHSVASLIIESTPGIARAALLALGGYWVMTEHWTLGSLLAFQAYLGYVFGPAQALASANLQIQQARASLERISALFEIVPEENCGVGIQVEKMKGQVEFKDVTFGYDSREPVLENISFRIQPGEHVAIVGPSGVGKTTLVSLILRFYKPASGEIYFDGRPASEYEVSSLRRRIGYVSQSTLLLSGTIVENLRYGNPEASEEEVRRAASAAEIDEFIRGLPLGYETPIGENGVHLSEGQRQRLSIARALVKDPDILILDEPTSALDSPTEKSIFQALPALLRGKTLFVVAHRLPTVQDADRVLLLNENRMVALGTHGALWEEYPYYRSLVADRERAVEPVFRRELTPRGLHVT